MKIRVGVDCALMHKAAEAVVHLSQRNLPSHDEFYYDRGGDSMQMVVW